ncbi:MAG: hypothetical protein ACXWD4_03610 [Bacteroidia bacterium]
MQLFLDDELPSQQTETMQLHISDCIDCNQKIQAEKAFKQSLKDKIERKHITDTILDGVRNAVHAEVV